MAVALSALSTLGAGWGNPHIQPIYSGRRPTTTHRDRLDPIHEVKWKDAVSTQWQTVGYSYEYLTLNSNDQLYYQPERVVAPVRLSMKHSHTPEAILAITAISHYYQLTTLQVASYLDTTADKAAKILSWLYLAGLVERAKPNWEPDRSAGFRPLGGTGHIWRLRNSSQEFSDWLGKLSNLEYLLIAGQYDLTKNTNSSRSSSSLRHNLVAAEIMLRAQEVIPGIIGAWGERFTTVESLMPHYDMTEGQIRQNIADGAIITTDGQIILIETSGQSSIAGKSAERLQAKAAAWTAICAMTDLDLKVIFVNMAEKPKPKYFRWQIIQGVRDKASDFIVNAAQLARGQDRIFMVEALDWFPYTQAISKGFLQLEAMSPMTGRFHNLLPETPGVDQDSDIVRNTVAGLHVPTWFSLRPE